MIFRSGRATNENQLHPRPVGALAGGKLAWRPS